MLHRLAWRNIWRNKRRTWITIASILFSVLLAVSMRSLQLGMYDRMIENVIGDHFGYVQVHEKGYWDEQSLNRSMAASDSLVEQALGISGFSSAAPRLEGFALASYEESTQGVRITGIDPERELLPLGEKLEEGRRFEKGERAVLIGKGIAEKMGVGLGDTLVFLGQGYQGMSAADKYPVAGVLSLSNPELNDRSVFLPLQEAQWYFGTQDRWTSIALDIGQYEDAARMADRLRSELDTARYEVMDWRTMMPELDQMIKADNAGGVIMVFILYMVIAFGIFGTVLMMTSERMKEFGILVAVGMKRRRLAKVVVLETLMLAFLGVAIGMGVSVPFLFYFHANPIELGGQAAEAMKEFGFEAVLPASTDPDILLTHGGIVLGVALLSSLYPLARILALNAVEAMRS